MEEDMVLALFLVHSLHSSGPRVRVAEAFRVGTVSKKSSLQTNK